MDARIVTFVLIIACVPVYNGFFIPAPFGVGSASESSAYEAAAEAANSPGLLLLHGPYVPSAGEEVESEVESELPERESESESENEANGGSAAGAGGAGAGAGGAAPAQARPDGGASGGAAGNAAAAAPGQAVPGGPQQISSAHAGRMAGVGVAVGACFLVALAVGVAVYVIRKQRQTRNTPERLQ